MKTLIAVRTHSAEFLNRVRITNRGIYGTEASQTIVSRITDKILPEINEWQNRPLDKIYPVIFFYGIVFNLRKDNKIVSKCVYFALGSNMGGHKEILGARISVR